MKETTDCPDTERESITERVSYWLWADGDRIPHTAQTVANDIIATLLERGWTPPKKI